jgi:type I restriction-modification system DNA methylase subunit/predicted type IV restriction endonuclease
MTVPSVISELVERFESHQETYRSIQYNEAQLREEFLNPFFEALGWDIYNKKGYAEAYKEVIHEDAIKIGGRTKAPDYCFRAGGGQRSLFIEAKKPSVDIGEAAGPAFQLRRYAWSAKLPVSILTDFEEFAVYDCRIRPDKNDKAATARVLLVNYKEYVNRWDELVELFSPEAIRRGSLERFVASKKVKKGTAEVDKSFLEEIESWRNELARNIALRNPQLEQRDLNFAVQRTIDRIIFLRICEDRGIEPYGTLESLQNAPKIYQRLGELFHRADDRYNSGLFHFTPEKDRPEPPDEMTLALGIDDKPLKEILRKLYFPESPYEFSVFPIEILGQVYEQFLGKVIRLTQGHQAKVEEKPEVRKAGGVYYTPSYIVDYIVKHTVGKLLEGGASRAVPGPGGKEEKEQKRAGMTPKQAEKLRILDPACGSGSFLIGAYTYLLDWHRDWYVDDGAEKHAKGRVPNLYRSSTGEWRLTAMEKKRILLNNIYGVDIDQQAVEVTKLSLLLKVLEGESSETLANQLRFFHERALPDLGANIKCGNSLIGPDFYNGHQLSMFEDKERYRINVFDWNAEFPIVFKFGGFDAVIGNPPYIPIETMTLPEKEYYRSHHPELERKYDSSIIFILVMLHKLNSGGRIGFISSLTWQTGENYRKLREYLFTKAGLVSLVNLPFNVFRSAYVDNGIYILSRKPSKYYSIFRFPKKEREPDLNNIQYTVVPIDLITPDDYKIVLDPVAQAILFRSSNKNNYKEFGEITISTQGLAANRFELKSKADSSHDYPFLVEGQVYRYFMKQGKLAYTSLKHFKSLKMFYEAMPKILIRRVINRNDRLMAVYCREKMVFKKDVNPFVISDLSWNPLYILGIINSRLISYLYINTSSIATKDDFRQTTLAELRRLPIAVMPSRSKKGERIVDLVDTMIKLYEKLSTSRTAHEKTVIQRQIGATDRQIDRLVYELYGLTEEEIGIIEQTDSGK